MTRNRKRTIPLAKWQAAANTEPSPGGATVGQWALVAAAFKVSEDALVSWEPIEFADRGVVEVWADLGS